MDSVTETPPDLARARALLKEGRFLELKALLAPVIALERPSAEAVLIAGECDYRLGLLQDAMRLYRKAEELDPSLPALRIFLAASRPAGDLTDVERSLLLPGFSLPHDKYIDARRFLDLVAAPNLSTVYTNDNIIVFQRALTFLRDAEFMGAVARSSEAPEVAFDDRT